MLQATASAPCRVCGQPFLRFSSFESATVCGVKCAAKLPTIHRKAAKALQRKEFAEIKRRKEAIKPRSQWLKEAQKEFNAYIRARDAHETCISCCRDHQGQWHAGHYLSTGARPELRFHEANVHKQCQPCNTHLHGNLVLYRVGLIGKVGLAVVGHLEGPHEPKHYSTEDLRRLIVEYRAKTKALTKETA